MILRRNWQKTQSSHLLMVSDYFSPFFPSFPPLFSSLGYYAYNSPIMAFIAHSDPVLPGLCVIVQGTSQPDFAKNSARLCESFSLAMVGGVLNHICKSLIVPRMKRVKKRYRKNFEQSDRSLMVPSATITEVQKGWGHCFYGNHT